MTRLGITPERARKVRTILEAMLRGEQPSDADYAELDAFTAECRLYVARVEERCAEQEAELSAKGVASLKAWRRKRRGGR